MNCYNYKDSSFLKGTEKPLGKGVIAFIKRKPFRQFIIFQRFDSVFPQ